MPFWEMRFGGRPVTSSPFSHTCPDVGRSTPVRQLKNVLLPAPLGPMIARISPRGTSMLTLLSAVSPPKRTVSPSVRRIGPPAPRPPRPSERRGGGRRRSTTPPSLGELAGRREDGLLLRDHLHDLVLAALDLEDELAEEGLVVFLAQGLVALREVVARLDLEALQRLDQLRGVLAAPEARLLHA